MRTKNEKKITIFRKKVTASFPGQIKKILLFGSRARKDHDRFSDYDLLIILDAVTSQTKEKLRQLAGEMLYEHNAVFSVFPFSEKDLHIRRFSPFILNAQKESIPV